MYTYDFVSKKHDALRFAKLCFMALAERTRKEHVRCCTKLMFKHVQTFD